jgi:hypothetical protein
MPLVASTVALPPCLASDFFEGGSVKTEIGPLHGVGFCKLCPCAGQLHASTFD